MRIEKRIRALEARMITEPIILHFADGTTRELCCRGTYLLSLMRDVCRGADLSKESTFTRYATHMGHICWRPGWRSRLCRNAWGTRRFG
jgi:hypothetical protein